MYYFIVNEHGGGGRASKTWRKVKKLMHTSLSEKGESHKAYKSSGPGDAKKIAEAVCRKIERDGNGDDKVIVVGGDGTINEVLNGITCFDKLSLGVIPTGSGNDFARGLGISKNTEEAFERILSGENKKRIDLGKTTVFDEEDKPCLESVFGISSGIGLDALVCKKVDSSKMKKVLNALHLGSLSYVLTTVMSLFTMHREDVEIVTTVAGDPDEEQTFSISKDIFVAAMNCSCEGGGVPMAPYAKVDDGYLSITAAYNVPTWRAIFVLLALVTSKHEKSKDFKLWEAKEIDLRSESHLTVHMDGEYGGETNHIKMKVLPGILEVL